MRPNRLAAIVLAATLPGCTFGAPSAATNSDPADTAIAVNLTSFLTGYSPDVLTVSIGTRIRFTNTDTFAHTATAIAAPAFPPASPFDQTALTPSGTSLSAPWSTGNLNAGAASLVFVADRPGTYLFGCFYHYAHPMRGEIDVR